MATFSSKGTVRSGRTDGIQVYMPPEQTYGRTDRGKRAGRDGRRMTPGEAARAYESALALEAETTLTEAETEADQLRSEAQKEAEQILVQARKEAQRLSDEAQEQGYQEGYARGVQEGVEQALAEHGSALKQQLTEFQNDLEQALASVAQAKEKSLQKYLDELRDCAIAVGEKVIHISLKSSGEVIKRMILAETEKLKKTDWVKIYMEKTDYEMMMQGDADVISQLSRLSDNVKFVVMNKDKSGRCIIETPEDIIDISVDTQMENIREILENIHG